jgi:hypothetical protein
MFGKKTLIPLFGVCSFASYLTAHAANRGEPWLQYLKSQIPTEEKLVKVGAMRPEDLQFDIQMVRIGDAITKADDNGNTAEAEKLGAELQSVRAQRLDFDRNIGTQHVKEAEGAEEITAAAQRSMAADSRLPNGRPAGAPAPHSGEGAHVCGSGPGPNEVQVGEMPGGNGVAAAPLCVWNN